MRLSGSQVSAAHTSTGRRPTPDHPAQYSVQHSAPRPGQAPAQDPNPTSGERLDAAPAATPATNVPNASIAANGFIPDLATGATTLDDSLDILVRLASATLSRLAGVEVECGVILNRVKRGSTTASTDGQTAGFARLEGEVGEGPLNEALTGSVLGFQLTLGEGTKAALAFFAPTEQAFPPEVIAQARSFADVASRGLRLVLELHATSARAADLQSALESRTSIDIACGVIMAQNRCSYTDAITIIATASSHRNIKLRTVAEGILANLPGGTPRTHFEH